MTSDDQCHQNGFHGLLHCGLVRIFVVVKKRSKLKLSPMKMRDVLNKKIETKELLNGAIPKPESWAKH